MPKIGDITSALEVSRVLPTYIQGDSYSFINISTSGKRLLTIKY
jgi:hypothetical protein